MLARSFFDSKAQLDEYRAHLCASGLPSRLTDLEDQFSSTVVGWTSSGRKYSFGGLEPQTGARLYALIRRLRPHALVETGVCNGVSSAFILQALHDNGQGRLYSIDLPEHAGEPPLRSELWSCKGGAVVPAGGSPGWVIPDELRRRWDLTLGRTQDELGRLLERTAPIDFFLRDSEHSYECMMFEFTTVYPQLADGGVLVTDDAKRNSAFADFAASVSRPVQWLSRKVALVRK